MSKRRPTVPRCTASNATTRTKSSDTRASSGAQNILKKTDTWEHLVIDVDEKLTMWPSESGNIDSGMGKARRKQASPIPGVVMAPWLFSRGNFVWRSTAGLIKCFETGRARERNKRVA